MFLKSLKISNLLSFGPRGVELPMQPLNVLIGANGSGKSNFLEVISLLQAAPGDLAAPVRKGGGIEEWLWKPGGIGTQARMEAVLGGICAGEMPLRHSLVFGASGHRLELFEERIETVEPYPGYSEPYHFYHFENGRAWLSARGEDKRELRRETIHPGMSILSQKKDQDVYPEITLLGDMYGRMRLYREWGIGRSNPLRKFQDTAALGTIQDEDLSNMYVVLSRLKNMPMVKQALLAGLKKLGSDFEGLEIDLFQGRVAVSFHEAGYSIPAVRLSDGTLHFLALLTILLHPEPPPLVAIEEPELALHPDLIPFLVALLREASTRMQIIVTTHSDILVDALTDTPEAVVVCDKVDMQTTMQRLESSALQEWLNEYRLGRGWLKGLIGGVRW